jgi:hypothetical protein
MHPFVTILFRPRATMRRILASPRDRAVIPIVLLAFCSSSINEFRSGKLPAAVDRLPGSAWLILFGWIIVSTLIALLLFYAMSWIAAGAGRVLDGEGKARDVRAALAWGAVPVIWAMLYRLPAALFVKEPSELRVGAIWIVYIALVLAELTVLVWWLVTTSNTLAVAHRFSAPRGFATLLLSLLAPFVLIAAGFLTAALKG